MQLVSVLPEHNVHVRRIYADALAEFGRSFEDVRTMLSSKFLLDPYKASHRRDCVTLVALDSLGTPAGFIIGAHMEDAASYLYMVVVPQLYRRRGIGRALLEKLQTVMGVPLMIKCASGNVAARLFFDGIARQVYNSEGSAVYVKDFTIEGRLLPDSRPPSTPPLVCVAFSDDDELSDLDD